MNYLIVLFLCVLNSSDPNGKFSFHAFVINNKILLYLYLDQAIRATYLRQGPSVVLDSHKLPKQCKVSSVLLHLCLSNPSDVSDD